MAAGSVSEARSLPLPPGPRGPENVRLLLDGRRPLQAFWELHRRFGDIARAGVPPMRYTALFHPEGAEHVLAHNHKNYRKGLINAQFKVLDGEGLVTSEGAFWQRQRRLAQPAFHRQRLAALGGVMTDAAAGLVERWRPYARDGRPFDPERDMMRLTLQVAGLALFGTDVSDDAGRISPAVDVARDYITWRFYRPWAPVWLPTPLTRRFHRARALLDRVVYGIIRERRLGGEDHGDLLSMLMLARDEDTGEGMDDTQLRDEVMTMLMAGHESTAVTLTWLWHVLGRYPEVQARVREEVDRVLGGRPPSAADVPALPYCRMVLEETLRLYPVVWGMAREAIEEDEIGGYRIPAGSTVTLCQYITHRRPDLWEDPERFDPERFSPERSEGRPRFAWFPFGGGPRGCIGLHFAMMEAQVVLAAVVQQYQVELASDGPVELEPLLSLRAKHGLPVRLRARRG